uniref:CRAL-TRIO domain-containing protein n=1 Tax=Arundo donax TaxID=35708 RepID=A0A0A8Y5P4_ARUDO
MFRRKHASHFNANDADQREAKINELKAALGPLSARGEKYCSEACLIRYLEARNWNVTTSRKMLEESLKWRAAYRPEDIRWPDVSVEAETGKMYRASFRDREGRTVVVMKPAKQNTSSHEGQIRFLVYVLENAILSLPESQEKMVWLIDFTGWTMANATPIKTARESSNILQNHYPESLAIAFLFNPPKVFEAFWKVIKIFLDPRSIEKVNFVYLKNEESMKVMHKYIDPEVLPVEFGGKNNVAYNHEEYSELMLKDDIKTASFWVSDAKTDHVNHVINGSLVPEVTPQSSLISAKAS